MTTYIQRIESTRLVANIEVTLTTFTSFPSSIYLVTPIRKALLYHGGCDSAVKAYSAGHALISNSIAVRRSGSFDDRSSQTGVWERERKATDK